MKNEKDKFKKLLLAACLSDSENISSYPTSAFEHSAEYNKRVQEILSGAILTPISHRRVVKIILISALILSLMLSAFACIPIIKKYIIQRNESDYSVSINPDIKEDKNEIVRTTIETAYIPSYIPEGYVEIQSTNDEFTVSFLWMNETDVITYDQWGNGGSYSFDAQAEYTTAKIGGYTVKYSIKHGCKNMFWEYDGYIFIFTCPDTIGFDEVERIIQSVHKAS